MSPSLAELLQDPRRVADVPVEALPALLGDLERLKATLWTRMMNANANGQVEGAEEDRLLAIDEVATVLHIKKGYVYELARRGEIPTIRIGKYVRIPALAFREWVGRQQKKGLDKELFQRYSILRDGRRASADPATPRTQPGAVGPTRRRHRE